MDYLLLIALIVVLIIIPFKFILNFKLFSPTIIVSFAYILSLLFAYIGLQSWNTQSSLNSNIYVLVLGSLAVFGFGEFLSKIKKKNVENKKAKYDINGIVHVSKAKYILSILFYIVVIILTIKELKKICATMSYNPKGISDMIAFYRQNSSLFSADAVNINIIVSQLLKVTNIMSIMYIYIIINNLINKDSFRKNIKYFIFIAFCIFICLLQTGRGALFKYIVGSFIIYTVLLYRKNKVKKQTDFNIIKKIFLALIIVLPIFYFIGPMFGRSVHNSFVDYITFYFGCPIPSLNIYLNSPTIHTITYTGEHLFYNIYSVLNRFDIINFSVIRSLNFINVGGMYSNVYSGVFRGYIDFGFTISLIFTFIAGFGYGKIYHLAYNKKNIKYLLFYAFFSAYIVDMFRDETFFSNFLSVTTLLYLIIICVVVDIFFKKYRDGDNNE